MKKLRLSRPCVIEEFNKNMSKPLLERENPWVECKESDMGFGKKKNNKRRK